MFDIGWTEIIVIVIVGSILLDIKDLRKIIKFVREFIKYINDIFHDVRQVIYDIEKDTKKIKDADGVEHIAYDLDDITPDLKKDDPKQGTKK